MAQTTKGILPIGIEVDGVLHRDFELRGATVMDNIEVTDELIDAGETPDQLRVSTAMMARQLISLGTLTKAQTTTALVRSLHITDWNKLDSESAALEKKLLGVEETPQEAGGSTSSPGVPDTASTPPTSTA
jgi:hypothetical protein